MSRSRARACRHQHQDGMRGGIARKGSNLWPSVGAAALMPNLTKPLLVPAEVSHLANPSWATFSQST